MREIKFRVQRNDTKEWCYFTLGDFVCCSTSTIGKDYDWENWGEFTGIKDKNGKEIYEGDVIQHPGSDDPLDKGSVFYEEGRAQFMVKQEKSDYELLDAINMSGMEVIGNVYDNPELLKR